MPKIKMRLSEKDILMAAKQLDQYAGSLVTKCNVFAGRLAELGFTVAQAKIGEAPLGKYVKLNVVYEPKSKGCKAVLFSTGSTLNTMSGSIQTLMMIEFGSGIHYNHDQNPKAGKFGMGVGTYPEQTHAFDENGWYFMDESGEWHHSYGVKATMPMYSADIEMIMNLRRVAKEVFSS